MYSNATGGTYGTPEGTFLFQYLADNKTRMEMKTKIMSFKRYSILSFERIHSKKVEWKLKQKYDVQTRSLFFHSEKLEWKLKTKTRSPWAKARSPE